ncbi:2-oxoglutarate dehydrogenase, E2 subunit, dihydrolipoamide succinyltransferase [Deinococcus proteolyticus MRP]|uniref:Dihydrolipoyllysine-residue succinyltransferase component of 2-oxoglutarate dehydrogenase complex n=1 Tax=Deinococcus proteolyticus (strain ATCC 35074 / DSM 20540 / JCM 6276 / NBRC 101906 / NCIMB 13154 / VKM Ac-1939 / CCM 2703 / MRP) TaxID=693977 RepID=F0RL95_DEIPM|nr:MULTISPECIES: 2-oxoglutarate dehydrogenase complex dihydrolipoyllysine-residue succinyltransferase [Deinococcus]ADY26887.1 2-oxoglutarate dehydrogenase, E2 subunit, dihydrolipoamide succinyltransferase [Deinococcus proteolyticus MRP]MCY1703010.1 2-oxoglutarate dehydrogenase complex dihydrolipoyllysine-residue succinyltransferase [Deinococcus sp. SL84]
MSQIKVPVFSESVSEGTLLAWNVQPGSAVKRGDVLAEIETDKVVLEVIAQEDGVLKSVTKNEGDTVLSEEVLGELGAGEAGAAPAAEAPATSADPSQSAGGESQAREPQAVPAPAAQSERRDDLSPAVRKIVAEKGLDASQVPATGPRGNITKADAMNAQPGQAAPAQAGAQPAAQIPAGARPEERVPMTRIRQKIAERLKEVQDTTAMLTTFNEVDMKPIMDLRKKYQDQFVAKHDIKLGFMSFFVRAATEALKQFPVVNASVDGKDIIYHGFYDIGIAVSTDRGLVVPILRDTDQLGLADIEKGIGDFAKKARAGKLTMEDMSGGTFTITNGGTFGSMMSTPIINAPQSAILGMHNIVERPVVVNGEIVIRPMMYVALSYDHRIIDGRDSVQFLVTIKNLLEDPARLLLDL